MSLDDQDKKAIAELVAESLKAATPEILKGLDAKLKATSDVVAALKADLEKRDKEAEGEVRELLKAHGHDYDSMKADEVEAALKEINSGGAKDDKGKGEPDPQTAGELRAMQKKLERLEKEREADKRKSADLEQRTREMRRDADVKAILGGIKVHDPEEMLALFKGRTVYDPKTDSWGYKLKSGEVVDLDHGIKEECPDWALQPSVGPGSGAGSAHGPQDKASRLTAVNAKIAEAEKVAREKGDSASVQAFMGALREKQAVEGQARP